MKNTIKRTQVIYSEQEYSSLVEKSKEFGLKPTTYSKMVVMKSINSEK